MGERETKARWKTERYLLERCGRWRLQGNRWKMHGKSWRYRWRRLCFVNWGRPSVPASCWKQTAKTKGSNKFLHPKKTKHACIVEVHVSTRQRLESSLPKDHDDHIAGKGYNSMTHYNFVHKFISMPQAMKIPDAKAAVDKEWKKLETNPAWNLGKSRAKRRLVWMHKRDQKKFPLCCIDGHMSPRKCGVRTKNQKYKGLCFEETLRQTTPEPAQFLLNRARLRPRWLLQKWWALLQDYQGVMDKQLMQCLRTLR